MVHRCNPSLLSSHCLFALITTLHFPTSCWLQCCCSLPGRRRRHAGLSQISAAALPGPRSGRWQGPTVCVKGAHALRLQVGRIGQLQQEQSACTKMLHRAASRMGPDACSQDQWQGGVAVTVNRQPLTGRSNCVPRCLLQMVHSATLAAPRGIAAG